MSLDIYGTITSMLCVLHCLIVSFASTLVDGMNVLKSKNEFVEWGSFAFALTFALMYGTFELRKHQNPIATFSMGIAALTLGRLDEALSLFEGGETFSIGGGIFLFVAHMYSARCCQNT